MRSQESERERVHAGHVIAEGKSISWHIEANS